jgi:hypothetical protein
MLKAIIALLCFTCQYSQASIIPIPVNGTGTNYQDPYDFVASGSLSFGGSNGVDTIQVSVTTPGEVTVGPAGGSSPMKAIQVTYDGTRYGFDSIITYLLGSGAGYVDIAHGATMIHIPLISYYHATEWITDWQLGPCPICDVSQHQDIVVTSQITQAPTSTPEPSTTGAVLIALALARLSTRHRKLFV